MHYYFPHVTGEQTELYKHREVCTSMSWPAVWAQAVQGQGWNALSWSLLVPFLSSSSQLDSGIEPCTHSVLILCLPMGSAIALVPQPQYHLSPSLVLALQTWTQWRGQNSSLSDHKTFILWCFFFFFHWMACHCSYKDFLLLDHLEQESFCCFVLFYTEIEHGSEIDLLKFTCDRPSGWM